MDITRILGPTDFSENGGCNGPPSQPDAGGRHVDSEPCPDVIGGQNGRGSHNGSKASKRVPLPVRLPDVLPQRNSQNSRYTPVKTGQDAGIQYRTEELRRGSLTVAVMATPMRCSSRTPRFGSRRQRKSHNRRPAKAVAWSGH